MAGLIYDTGTNCVDLDSYTSEICLPQLQNCGNSCDFLLKEESELWNCNLCQTDKPYCIPYKEGQKIHIQTNFVDEVNADPTNPTQGWGSYINAQLLDKDGSVVSANYSDFASQHLVGYSGSNSYQLLEIDTTQTPDCFSVRITTAAGRTVTSEPYCKSHDCDKLIAIQGKFDCEDNCGNYYGEPESFVGSGSFTYDNTICVVGVLKKESSIVNPVISGNGFSQSTIRQVYSVRLGQAIPPYLHCALMNNMAGGKVCVDGKNLTHEGLQPDNLINGNMFLWSIELFEDNTKDFKCKC